MPPPRFVKTAAGVDEISTRQRGLPPRLRRLLILVDGRRDHSELAALLGGEAVAAQLEELAEAGLVAPAGAAPQSPAPQPEHVTPKPAAPEPMLSPLQLEHAKALMTDSAHRYLGVFARPLLASIAAAADHRALKSVSAAWHMALRDSRDGRGEADHLLHTLRELIEAR